MEKHFEMLFAFGIILFYWLCKKCWTCACQVEFRNNKQNLRLIVVNPVSLGSGDNLLREGKQGKSFLREPLVDCGTALAPKFSRHAM